MDIRIRDYSPADRDDVLRIWREASQVGHPFLSETDLAGQYEQIRDHYLDLSKMYVADCDGQAVGFIGLLGEKRDFIGALFVLPAYHRYGIGRTLLEHAAKQRRPLYVEVYAKNEVGFPFYVKNGFVEESRRDRDDEGRPLEIVRLRRD